MPVLKCIWGVIQAVLEFIGTKIWNCLCYCWRQICGLKANLNWFGVLMFVIGLVVNARIIYITYMKEATSLPNLDKQDLADEKAVWVGFSIFLSLLGSSITSRDEDRDQMIVGYERARNDKDYFIGIMRFLSAALIEEHKNLEEEHWRTLRANEQLQFDIGVLKDHQKRLFKEHMKTLRAKDKLALENGVLQMDNDQLRLANDQLRLANDQLRLANATRYTKE